MKSFCRYLRWLGCLSLATGCVGAGELKVDINRDSKNLDNATEVNYTKWSADASGGATTGTNAATKVFTTASNETVSISFSQTAASASRGGTGLLSGWYQIGAQGTAKLVSDGFSVAPAALATGGEIQMTITGLFPGHHTLLTYHNQWDANNNGGVPTFSGPLDIFLNGTQMVDNLQPTIRAVNNVAAPVAYLEFDVASTNDVTTIIFAAETNTVSPVTIKNPMINGFEIDTPNSTRVANTPSPADGDEHVNADSGSAILSWSAATASNAVSHTVYFGTNLAAVKNATPVSAEFKTNQIGTNYSVMGLKSLLTYYWRVDEIDSVGNATKGTVWMFRPRHLAFPGAEGYGRFARGGRGGVVIEVTNTNDSGPGSLRDALTNNYGPRTVVFAVSGLITLEADLIISQFNPYITLAGQTTPGKGICTRKYQLGISGGRDLIVRHVRSRPGNISGTTLNGSGMSGSDYCIMDHISISWGIDEELSTRTSKNITFQRSLISEALNIAGHQNYPAGTAHGYAASVGGNVASLHHNLLAHNEGRNWSLAGGLDAAANFAGRLDIFNNVIYNWGHRTTDGGAMQVNFVANYYKPGAASTFFYALNAQYDNFPGTQQYFFTNNVMPGHFGLSNQSVGREATPGTGSVPTNYPVWVGSPFFPSYATIDTATNAYKLVLSDVGCNQPLIDDHDARVICETIDGTYTYTGTGPYGGSPGLPNSQDDVGGWENYPALQRPAGWDSDHDGLPDWWELAKGLNPNSTPGDFSDSNGDPDGDEFTNLEDYLNWLAAIHLDGNRNTNVDLDLTQFTRGFTNNSPVYVVSNPTNGTVALIGGKVARFTPTANFYGLGSFQFKVADAQGASVTNIVGVHVRALPISQLSLLLTNGAPQLRLTGESGMYYLLQSSDDLKTWTTWTNATVAASAKIFAPPGFPNPQARFYRAISVQ
jgi:hypothetical protein